MSRALLLLACLGGASGLVVLAAPRAALGRPVPLSRVGGGHVLMRGDDDVDIDRPFGSTEDFGTQRRVEKAVFTAGGLITVIVPVVLGIWAYNEGYLTPQ